MCKVKRKMAHFGFKTGQRRDVRGNVATLQRGLKPTSRRSGQRRDVTESGTKQRHDVGNPRCDVTESGIKQSRDVEYQRRDVPETHKNSRRDVDYSRRDVPESIKIDVATLEIHDATL